MVSQLRARTVSKINCSLACKSTHSPVDRPLYYYKIQVPDVRSVKLKTSDLSASSERANFYGENKIYILLS